MDRIKMHHPQARVLNSYGPPCQFAGKDLWFHLQVQQLEVVQETTL